LANGHYASGFVERSYDGLSGGTDSMLSVCRQAQEALGPDRTSMPREAIERAYVFA